MKDWLTPDYSTVNILCQTHRMTVDGGLIDHEGRNSGAWVNEGPFMIKRNGTYMMTFSVYPYTHVNYQVRLATSSNPLSGFTKIDPYNGGTVIKTVIEWDGVIQSVGHHSFIEVGDEVFIAYHTFKNRQNIAQGRALAIDKVEFVNHNGKEIMFTNGPTYGYQPLPVEVSGYKNIASEATVTAEGIISGDKAYLTDGLIQHHSANEIGDIGKEVEFNGQNNKITLEFSTYKNVRAIMVNLGRKWAYALGKIKKVTLTYLSDSGDKQVVVDDMQYDYNKFVSDPKKRVYPGGAAILEFADLPIKKIEIELSGVDGYDFTITEVQVLANTKNTTITPVTDAKLVEKYSYTNAPVPAAIKRISGETLGSATAGGVDFHTNYGYDLSKDTATEKSVKTMGPRDQFAYFKNYSQDVVYFEGKLNVYASESYMGDKYPKLGLIARNSEACTFFYIDGANNYSNMMVGYTQSKIGGGDWDWGATEITKNAPGILYKGANNYVKLGMARIDGDFYFFLNDILYFSSPEQRGMPDGREAVYGFLCFNTGMEVKDYSILTDREEVQAKVDLLRQNKQEEQINGAAFGSIDGNELVTTGATWDLTMDYAPDHHQYDSRQVSLASSDGADNHLFFINESATTLYLEAEFETTGIIANDDYAKFGVMFKNAGNTGIYFYVDAHTGVKQTTSNLADIKGTSVGYVQRVSGAYQWPGVETANKYNPTSKIKLGVYRQGNYYKVLVNDELLYTTTCSIGGAIYPAIFSFNVGLVVTNYSITSDPNNQMIKDLFIKTSTDDGSVTGLTFGDANDNMKQVGTWVTGIGNGSSSGAGDSVTWASGIGGSNFYFEADIKAGNPINGDKWPKVGLVVRDASTEVIFVIDALNTGNYGSNNWVGYGIRQTNGVSVGAWDFSCQFVQVPGMIYTGGASTKMGIWFNNGKIYMTANGRVVLKVADVPGLDSSETLNANVGVMGWGMTFSFENAIAKADATALATLSDNLGITDSANGITIDGSAADWTGAKASYYSAYSEDGTRGFKVSAYKGATGVYALVEGVSSTFVTDYDQGGWWLRTNTEMRFYNTNDTQTKVYVAANGECSNAWLFYINSVKRADNLYDVTIELFVPYSSIGYTGEEDYVAGFFAYRPGTESDSTINAGGVEPQWWFGKYHLDSQSYAGAATTYKITANGLVGTDVTTVS